MADSDVKIDPMILIRKVLDKAAIDGALTDDAAKYFHTALRENKELKAEVLILEQQVKTRDEAVNKLNSINSDLISDNNACIAREDELKTREEKMLKLELTAQYERERVDDHKEMFSLVFRNLETRRTIFTPYEGYGSSSDQYGTFQPGSPAGVQQDEEIGKTE